MALSYTGKCLSGKGKMHFSYFIIACVWCACHQVKDKAHGVDIDNRLREKLVISMADTLNKKYNLFSPPEKLKRIIQDELEGLIEPEERTESRRFYYFKDFPEEVYVVSYYMGYGTIELVYEVKTQKSFCLRDKFDGLSERAEDSLKARVSKRFKNYVLDVIEREAKKEGIPNNLIYEYR